MRFSLSSSALLAATTFTGVSAAPAPAPQALVDPFAPAPKLDLSKFPGNPFVKPLTLEEAKFAQLVENITDAILPAPKFNTLAVSTMATCSNPKIRYEWDNAPDTVKQNYINAVRCLVQAKPSGKFSNAKNRYEDFIALHQLNTPNVHGSAKFLIWHRYFLWAFEDVLRTECGFNDGIPWFEEARWTGKFSQSSIFSSQWMGSIGINGNCVTNGQFANLALNVGPGTDNIPHCLARAGNSADTGMITPSMVDACQQRSSFADMAACSEGGAHAWGHNGVGAVMKDVYASPGDPFFWLHHSYIDRNFRVWQNGASSRTTTINGNDKAGNPLTLDTGVFLQGVRPDVKIRDILNTMDGVLCYKYNY